MTITESTSSTVGNYRIIRTPAGSTFAIRTPEDTITYWINEYTSGQPVSKPQPEDYSLVENGEI